MTDKDHADRLDDIASRMFPNGHQRPTMTEEEIAAKADEIVADLRRKRNERKPS